MNDQLTLVRQYIDAPEPIIKLATVDAMRDFCQQCDAWIETFRTAVKTTSLSYNLILPLNSELVAVKAISGASGGWGSDGISRVTLDRQPPEGVLEITMRLKPVLGAPDIPDQLKVYRDAVRAGTLARLYSQRGTDWHDPEEAMRWQQEYAGFLGDARIAQAQRHADAVSHAKAPPRYRIGRRGRRI